MVSDTDVWMPNQAAVNTPKYPYPPTIGISHKAFDCHIIDV